MITLTLELAGNKAVAHIDAVATVNAHSLLSSLFKELGIAPELPESLEAKQAEVDRLVTIIQLNNRNLTLAEREKVDAVDYGLQVRLEALVDECKKREMDTKIHSMREILNIVKVKHHG